MQSSWMIGVGYSVGMAVGVAVGVCPCTIRPVEKKKKKTDEICE